ncbi:MAG TPA: hypothetical protein VH593_33210, partial [Ktedonobacteraceae bacterium]
MKVAVIPPLPNLEIASLGSMHLVLNHMLDEDAYRSYYRKQGEQEQWLTLDNSAHEMSSGRSIEELLPNAIVLRAREIVLPDHLFHAMYTVESGRDALAFLAKSTLFKSCSPTPRLMVVPQGHDEADWVWCLRALVSSADAHGFLPLLTIGLSKDYERFEGGLNRLLGLHLQPLWERHQIPVHILGWPCTWEIIHLARRYPYMLRSIDSAKPVIYAQHGKKLTHLLRP